MAEVVMIVRGRPKAEWDAWPFKPLENEVTFDKDNKRLKIGDNENFWKDLPYVDIDVIDNLKTVDSKSALSATQGKVLKDLVDLKADKTELTQLQQDLTTIINNISNEDWTFTLEDESEVQKKVAVWSSQM